MPVSWEHVIWAWDEHICDLRREGKTVEQIRLWLYEDRKLAVSAASIRDVLRYHGLLPAKRVRPAA